MSGAVSPGEARLYVCETCVRDLAIAVEERTRGIQLADAIADRITAIGLAPSVICRTVLCLNGCPRPCNVALRAPGKCSLRLGRLTPSDAKPIVEFLLEYSASPDGNVPLQRWPAELRDKVTARTPPLGPKAEPITT
jgi:predicted metal-binding protein